MFRPSDNHSCCSSLELIFSLPYPSHLSVICFSRAAGLTLSGAGGGWLMHHLHRPAHREVANIRKTEPIVTFFMYSFHASPDRLTTARHSGTCRTPASFIYRTIHFTPPPLQRHATGRNFSRPACVDALKYPARFSSNIGCFCIALRTARLAVDGGAGSRSQRGRVR